MYERPEGTASFLAVVLRDSGCAVKLKVRVTLEFCMDSEDIYGELCIVKTIFQRLSQRNPYLGLDSHFV
jgi:hypothetical protein